MRAIIRDCDKRIEMNQRRVEENEKDKEKASGKDLEISELLTQHEALMENGELDEAQAVQNKIDELRAAKAAAAAAAEPRDQVGSVLAQMGNHPQYQALRVCEQCGLLLSAKETTKLEDHYIGKLHTGFVEIRAKLDELGQQRETREKAPEFETDLPEPPQRASSSSHHSSGGRDHRSHYGSHRDSRYRDEYREDPRSGGGHRSRYDRDSDRDRDRYRNRDRYQDRRDRDDYDRDSSKRYRDRDDDGYRERDSYRDRH